MYHCRLQAGSSPALLFCCGLPSGKAGSLAAISVGDELLIGDKGWQKRNVGNVHQRFSLLAAWLGWLLGTADSHLISVQIAGFGEKVNPVASFQRSPALSSLFQRLIRHYI